MNPDSFGLANVKILCPRHMGKGAIVVPQIEAGNADIALVWRGRALS